MEESMDALPVFLSYAEADGETAEKLAHILEKRLDIEVFRARSRISGGKDWFAAIDRELRGCRCAVVLATPKSMGSDWVRLEVALLRALHKTVIAYLVGMTTEGLPLDQGGFLVRKEGEIERLLEDLAKELCVWEELATRKLTGAPALPDGVRIPHLDLLGEQDACFDPRRTLIVYTCRGKKGCPDPDDSVRLHTPIDELRTVANLLHAALERMQQKKFPRKVFCSRTALGWLPPAEPGLSADTSTEKDPFEQDWLVVGCNDFSVQLFGYMNAYLPWRDVSSTRTDVKAECEGKFVSKGSAVLTEMPNPFNLQRRIILLWGCHQEGQNALETWFWRPDSEKLLQELGQPWREGRPRRGLQIVVSAPMKRGGPDYPSTHVVKEGAMNHWEEPLGSPVLAEEGAYSTHPSVREPGHLVDVSLLLPLPEASQAQLRSDVTKLLPSEETDCWEESEVGLHVTLVELLVQDLLGPPTESELEPFIRTTQRLATNLYANVGQFPPARLRIRQMEVMGNSLSCLADFIDEHGRVIPWLARALDLCGSAKRALPDEDEKRLWSRPRASFPLHMTLFRFGVQTKKARRAVIGAAIQEARRRTFMVMPAERLCLCLATRRPYGGIVERRYIDLEDPR